MIVKRTSFAALLLLLGACASAPVRTAPGDPGRPGPGAEPAPRLPAVPAADGPLQLRVQYPAAGAAIAARDSNFIFGSVGSGRATLRINGSPVTVAPNGAFLAFLPVPPNGVYRLEAARGAETASSDHTVQVPAPPATAAARAAITGVSPSGAHVVGTGERIEVRVRATPGARVVVVLPDGARFPLVESSAADETGDADNFRSAAARAPGPASALYRGLVPVRRTWSSPDTGVARPRLSGVIGRARADAARDSALERQAGAAATRDLRTAPLGSGAQVELVLGGDTVRRPLALNVEVLPSDLSVVGVVNAPANAPSDWMLRGRIDTGGPFHYFWPAGTRLHITGERDGFYRVRLAGDLHAWAPAADVRLLPAGTPAPGGAVAAVRFRAEPEYVDLRIPLPERLPFHVEQEGERTLVLDVFGATSRVNFFQYGSLDPLLERAQWSQPADGVYRVRITLAQPVWGWHTLFDAGDALVLRIRRPPAIDPARPLSGLLIALDAGHPPGGAIGPTGLTEAEANLAIAQQLLPLLERAGARVLMTRTDASAVELGTRPRIATEANAHLLISVHNNAFPDGVNPFTSNGTSAYYFHPHSVDLARALQAELLRELGLRDIGIGRADLALVRPSWMPAVLTETMYLMVPEQEAALRDPSVHRRIAEAHLRALESFLRARAAAP